MAVIIILRSSGTLVVLSQYANGLFRLSANVDVFLGAASVSYGIICWNRLARAYYDPPHARRQGAFFYDVFTRLSYFM